MKANFLLTALLAVGLLPLAVKAQNPVYKESTLAHPADSWEPVKFADGTNLKNGVTVYIHTGECNGAKVKFLKLVNMNNYPVKFSYQVTAESPVVEMSVPALKTVDGACNVTDANLAKLTVTVPVSKSPEENKANKEYIRSHIEVAPMQ